MSHRSVNAVLSGGQWRTREEIIALVKPLYAQHGEDAQRLAESCADTLLQFCGHTINADMHEALGTRTAEFDLLTEKGA